MHQTIHVVQLIFGVALALGLLGWGLYRLAVWFKIVTVSKRTKPARHPTQVNQTSQAGAPVATKGQKKGVASVSRRTLYTARRERG